MSARPICRECGANRHAGQPHAEGCEGRKGSPEANLVAEKEV